MNDHELKQRIQYLIEHGGLIDDPLAEIRRHVRWAMWSSVAAVGLGLVGLAV